ncbi:MAG: hypothetical protein HY746_05000 [Elusimicrobia bacterium]|nr:hypothetical protein [Elusimicrobiota bacterium]
MAFQILIIIFFSMNLNAAAEILFLDEFSAADMPYDAGEEALLKWKTSPLDSAQATYQVFASTMQTGGWIKVDEFSADKKFASDIKLPFWAWKARKDLHAVAIPLETHFGKLEKNKEYFFKIISIKGRQKFESEIVSTQVKRNWFNFARLNNLVFVLVIFGIFIWTVSHAKRKGLFIRRIAGLDAIDEAIGRATEMGRPIYYITGIGSMSSISTIASTFILGEVAGKVAQYDSYVKVPHYNPIVMTVCKEVVRQAYLQAGRPDSYREDMNFFVSSDQFSYAASVDGMITREKPAACFLIGHFMAESLLLAEVGATVGAIQIAGTDSEHQLPFFFTTCDYTLIGEELYAAGAYLSKEPMLLSTLRLQDYGKFFVIVAVVIGIALMTLSVQYKWDLTDKILENIFKTY